MKKKPLENLRKIVVVRNQNQKDVGRDLILAVTAVVVVAVGVVAAIVAVRGRTLLPVVAVTAVEAIHLGRLRRDLAQHRDLIEEVGIEKEKEVGASQVDPRAPAHDRVIIVEVHGPVEVVRTLVNHPCPIHHLVVTAVVMAVKIRTKEKKKTDKKLIIRLPPDLVVNLREHQKPLHQIQRQIRRVKKT